MELRGLDCVERVLSRSCHWATKAKRAAFMCVRC